MAVPYETFLLPILLFNLVLAPWLGWWLAKRKGRRGIEGLVLGLLLTWIGVVVEAALPGVDREGPRHERRA